MPVMMSLLGYKFKPEFKYANGFNLKFDMSDLDAYCSLYVPSPDFAFNRISITGNQVVAEYSFPELSVEMVDDKAEGYRRYAYENCSSICVLLGLDPRLIYHATIEVKLQTYSKIVPIDDMFRKEFLHWATDNFNIFSLGRYATWRPGLLLDDIVNDIRVISRMMDSRYFVAQQRMK